MKRLLAVLAAFALTTAAFATPAEDMLKAAPKTEAGLVAMADKAPGNKPAPADQKNAKPTLDPVAFEALILAYADAKVDAKTLNLTYSSYPAEAFSAVSKKYALPDSAAFLPRLLAHSDPKVRARTVLLMEGFLFGTSSAARKAGIQLMAAEKDPIVLNALIRVFANDGAKDAAIGKFLVGCLSHPDPRVRARAVIQCCSIWNSKTPGFAKRVADMMNTEKDPETRKAILERAGRLGNEEILLPAYKTAAQDADPLVRSYVVSGLLLYWWDYPFLRGNSQEAYNLTLQVLKTFPGVKNLKSSAFVMCSNLKNKPSGKTYDAWKARTAAWYKPEEVRAALLPIVEDQGLSSVIRGSAIDAMITHGLSKADFEALMGRLEAAGDRYVRSFRSKGSKIK